MNPMSMVQMMSTAVTSYGFANPGEPGSLNEMRSPQYAFQTTAGRCDSTRIVAVGGNRDLRLLGADIGAQQVMASNSPTTASWRRQGHNESRNAATVGLRRPVSICDRCVGLMSTFRPGICAGPFSAIERVCNFSMISLIAL